MKLKKFFAGVLAAAMMLTVGAPQRLRRLVLMLPIPVRLANTMQICLCRLMVRLKLI